MKRPAFQFYPADWRKDVELRACSIAARGLWIDLMCLAHECEPYGHLTINGKPMTPAQIAGQIGLTVPQCRTLLRELIDNGVARQTPDGTVYSKRMVDDEALRTVRAEGGKGGAEHGVKGAEHGLKGGRPKKVTGDLEPHSKPPLVEAGKPPSEPPPSSSSSSSASARDSEANASAPLTAKDQVWLLGPPLVGDKGRGALGKLVKTYGDELVAEVLVEATNERPIEPLAWVTAACATRSKQRPRTNGHAPQSTLDLLNREPRPEWVIKAGFEDIFAAESHGCGPGNFRKFRGGQRVEQ